ncbi:MAG TPA: OmpA family protein [Bacteroidales bacterium]|nr:OmpA family protein [Bacteroidales bacterium]
MMRFPVFALSSLLILLLASQVRAQGTENPRAAKQYEKAVQLYDRRDYAGALKQLDVLLEDAPAYIKGWLLRADMFLDLKQFPEAINSYSKAVSIDSAFFPPAYYIMANLYFDSEKYAEAKINYLSYLRFNPKIQAELKRVYENLKLCDFRMSLMRNPVPYNPLNIGPNINSQGYEYINAVSLDESQLFFTRKAADPRADESFFRAVSARSASGQLNWSPAIEIGAPLNTPGNEGALCVSPDGMTIIITCCSRQDSYGSCDLYSSRRVGNNWSEPINLGSSVNTASWESQPCLAADGRTLYFVSTRAGGHGGSDIWKSVLQDDGSWTSPVNLGDSINSPGNEMAPFIHPDGRTLYFSSTGHPGMGGADLFISRLSPQGTWQKPENLGYPVNTKLDEINLVINAQGTEAYISAERTHGFGNTDIYRFELPAQVRPESVSYVHGKVFDKNTLLPLAASFELIDMQSNTVVVSSGSDPQNGEFVMSLPVDKQYALNVSCKGYLFYSVNFSVKGENDKYNPVKLDVPMNSVAIGEKVVLRNIFFDTDKYDLLPDSKAELGKLVLFLLNNPAMNIEIGGHTDQEGSDAHNITLSQNRAKAVYDYLVLNGIPPSRLTYKGYGESMPIDSNQTPDGRAKNRRTEFKVISK